MTNLKKVFLVMVVIILLGATAVFATTDGTIYITDENPTTDTENTIDITNTANTVTNTTTNTVINVTEGTNTSVYNNTTNLPQTGANDYAMITIIAVFAVFAVYAYKKVSDYKNI